MLICRTFGSVELNSTIYLIGLHSEICNVDFVVGSHIMSFMSSAIHFYCILSLFRPKNIVVWCESWCTLHTAHIAPMFKHLNDELKLIWGLQWWEWSFLCQMKLLQSNDACVCVCNMQWNSKNNNKNRSHMPACRLKTRLPKRTAGKLLFIHSSH